MATQNTDLIGPLCRTEDIPNGFSRGFDPLGEGRDTMFIVRHGDQFFAWRNACPHYDQARMAWKKDEFLTADKTQIVCGAHGALFEIDTGDCVRGPCLGKKLATVDLHLERDKIYVVGPYAPGRRKRTPVKAQTIREKL